MNKEISKINFVLEVAIVEFLSCGLYNKYYFKSVISDEFTYTLMITLMAIVFAFSILLLMRSNVCRSTNMALATGILPAVIIMYAAYLPQYQFQIISTWLICALSIIRTVAGLRRSNLPEVAKKMLLIRYSIMLVSTMGLVAFIFITM